MAFLSACYCPSAIEMLGTLEDHTSCKDWRDKDWNLLLWIPGQAGLLCLWPLLSALCLFLRQPWGAWRWPLLLLLRAATQFAPSSSLHLCDHRVQKVSATEYHTVSTYSETIPVMVGMGAGGINLVGPKQISRERVRSVFKCVPRHCYYSPRSQVLLLTPWTSLELHR